MHSKKCSQCGVPKELKDFWTDYRAKDGTKSYCKACGNRYNGKKPPKEKAKEYQKTRLLKYENDPIFRKYILERQRRYRTNFPEKIMLSQAKTRAKRGKLVLNIDISDIVIPEYCPLLGIKLHVGGGMGHKHPDSPSLDRVNVGLGYVKGNVRVISDLANTMKQNCSIERLLLFAKNLPEYLNQ